MTKKLMVEWMINEYVTNGRITQEEAPGYHKNFMRMTKAKLEVEIDKIKATQPQTTETTDLNTGDVKIKSETKYVWPEHLSKCGKALEAIGLKPGSLCNYLRGNMNEDQLRVWFVQDYYLVQDAAGVRRPRESAKQAMALIAHQARNRGFKAFFRPDHLAIWR